MSNIQIYTKSYCPHCAAAKATLSKLGLSFEEIEVSTDQALQQEMRQRSQRRTVPQIFIGDKHVGGNDDLNAARRSGALEQILAAQTVAA